MLLGFDNPTTQLQNVQPELLLKFPFQYGDSVGSYYYAHGKYGNRLEMDVMGTTKTTADVSAEIPSHGCLSIKLQITENIIPAPLLRKRKASMGTRHTPIPNRYMSHRP